MNAALAPDRPVRPPSADARGGACAVAAPGSSPAAAVFSNVPVSRDPRALLGPLHKLAELGRNLDIAVAGTVSFAGERYEIPRLRFAGPAAGHDPIRLGLFAGIHGDEPAGCHALIEFAAALANDPARAAGYELFLYPLINPVGFVRGTRTNHTGKDLNRCFWRGSREIEVRVIEAELRARPLAGIITLHADDTCNGVYGYAHGRTLNEALLAPALAAAGQFLSVDARAEIDGFPACAGLIRDCFTGVLSPPPEQRPKPFDLIFETPAHAPLDLQVAASVAALETIITVYPGFISYAQDL